MSKHITRVVIFGSRYMKDQKVFNAATQLYLYPFENVEIVEGGQVSEDFAGRKWGADYFAAEYAKANALMHTTFDANWGLYGNKAGPLRNRVMGEYCEFCYGLAFWDGRKEKCGTWDMIQRCEEFSIQLKIINI